MKYALGIAFGFLFVTAATSKTRSAAVSKALKHLDSLDKKA